MGFVVVWSTDPTSKVHSTAEDQALLFQLCYFLNVSCRVVEIKNISLSTNLFNSPAPRNEALHDGSAHLSYSLNSLKGVT